MVGTVHHTEKSVEAAVERGWRLSDSALDKFDQCAFNDSCAQDEARWSTWRAGDWRPSYPYKHADGAALSEAQLAFGHGVEIPPQDLVLDLWLDLPNATDAVKNPLLLWEEWKQVNRYVYAITFN